MALRQVLLVPMHIIVQRLHLSLFELRCSRPNFTKRGSSLKEGTWKSHLQKHSGVSTWNIQRNVFPLRLTQSYTHACTQTDTHRHTHTNTFDMKHLSCIKTRGQGETISPFPRPFCFFPQLLLLQIKAIISAHQTSGFRLNGDNR